MKTIIPQGGKVPIDLSNNIIPVELIDLSKIIVVDNRYTSALGIVTRVPPERPVRYGVIDLFKCYNYWPNAFAPTVMEVINMFPDAYQFDSRQEFIQWLVDTKYESSHF